MALLDAWSRHREITAMIGHTAAVNGASFSPDGRRVVTASWDNTARVWDLAGPAPVATVLAGHTNVVTSASFSPDGRHVVTASGDATVVVHPVPTDEELVHLARGSLTRCLTVEQSEVFGFPVENVMGSDRALIRPPPC
jgi:WD40 repeat protein